MLNATILIIEDDKRLAELLVQELGFEGHRTTVAHTGGEGLLKAEEQDFDLIVLDLNLPDMDGIEIAERLSSRKTSSAAASILMLTARGDVGSRVEGLYAGASDYMTKPFSLQELLARIHVRLRERESADKVLEYKDVELDLSAKLCRVNSHQITLTAQEFKLLELLLQDQGRIYSKEDLERKLYSGDDLPGSNTIEVFVSNVRRKLAAAGADNIIGTVRGMGYMVQ